MIKLYRILLFCLSGLCMPGAFAQEGDYQTLQSRRQIPQDFIENSSDKYYQDLASKVTKEDKRFTRKSKEAFYLQSNFNIDRFLSSGKVMFNDQVSDYLGEVLDELLKNDKPLREKIRVYTVKSAAVNAYTTEDGIIFVNLGLLARLKNEAQLAFVLSHEVIHFKEKHVINSYVKAREISAAKGDYRRLSFDEKTFTKSSYDKEQELDADHRGLEIYVQSEYDRKAMEQVFNILKFADYPAMERVFEKKYFESGDYKFPDHYYLAHVKDILADENYDDSKSSHPNIAKRKESLNALLSSHAAPAGKGKEFIVSEGKFGEAKKIAQFELSRSYLLSGEITEALLNAYAMEKAYPKSAYLRKNVLKALYNMARYGHSATPDEERGERQRLLYFFKDFNETEYYTLAIRNLYLYHEQHPGDEEVELMLVDLVYDAAIKDEFFEQRFRKFGKAPQKPLENKEKAYVQHAFSGFKDEAAFFTYLEEKCEKARKWDKDKKLAKKRKKKKAMEAPSINKTLVINPLYIKLDARKKEKMRYEDSEAILTRVDDKVEKAAERLGMEAPVLNTLNFGAADIEKFNNHSIVQEWLVEKLRHESPTGVSPVHNEMKVISEAYGTQYFTWMGGVAVTEKKPFSFLYLVYGAYFPPSIPLWLYLYLKPEKNAFYFSFTFDVRNEGIVEGDMRSIKMRDNESLMQSNIYYTLFQLKN